MGPTVAVMPGPTKPFSAFQEDQAICRQFADQQVGGAQQAETNQTLIGAGVGFGDFSGGEASAQSVAKIGLNPTGVTRLFERFRRDPAGTRWSRVWAIFIAAEWCRRHQVRL